MAAFVRLSSGCERHSRFKLSVDTIGSALKRLTVSHIGCCLERYLEDWAWSAKGAKSLEGMVDAPGLEPGTR